MPVMVPTVRMVILQVLPENTYIPEAVVPVVPVEQEQEPVSEPVEETVEVAVPVVPVIAEKWIATMTVTLPVVVAQAVPEVALFIPVWETYMCLER